MPLLRLPFAAAIDPDSPGGTGTRGGGQTATDNASSSFVIRNFSNTPLLTALGNGAISFGTNLHWDYAKSRLGIGTAAPDAPLHVAGVLKITGSTPGAGKVLTSDANGLASWSTPVSGSGAATRVAFWDGASSFASSSDLNWDNSNSRLGIGTAAPAKQLQFTGNLRMTVMTATAGILYRDGDRFLHGYGSNNTFLGSTAGNLTMTGSDNTAMGWQALTGVTCGNSNTAVGSGALTSIVTNSRNSALGYQALKSNTGGSRNTGLGAYALWNNGIGIYNTAVGDQALYSNTGGGSNTAIGMMAGYSATASSCVYLGFQAGYNNTSNNKLLIENTNAAVPLIWGDFDVDRVGINRVATANAFEVECNASKTVAGAWDANSDRRIKTQIADIRDARVTIMQMRPVSFRYTDTWRERHPAIRDRVHYNVIAQEYREVFPDDVKGGGAYLDGEEVLQVDPYTSSIVLIRAVQELIEENRTLTDRMRVLEEALRKMEEGHSNDVSDGSWNIGTKRGL